MLQSWELGFCCLYKALGFIVVGSEVSSGLVYPVKAYFKAFLGGRLLIQLLMCDSS